MAVVPDRTIAEAALSAGFPRDQIATAVAVALAESGGNATAKNTANTNGTTDYGLWQINSIHKADLASGNWADPKDNARMAVNVYRRAGNKWTPWVAWKKGRHLGFLPRGNTASMAVLGTGATPNDDGGLLDIDLPGVDQLQALAVEASRAVKVLTDRDTWVRIGIGTLGGVLLIVAVVGLLWTLGGRQVASAVIGATPIGRVGRVGRVGKASKAVKAVTQ